MLRPIRYYQGVPSPVKNPQNVNMVIFRENTEDIYAGIEYAASSDKAKKIIGLLDEFGDKNKIRFPELSRYWNKACFKGRKSKAYS